MLNYEQTQVLEQAIFLLQSLRNEIAIENWEVQRTNNFLKEIKRYEVISVLENS